MPSKVWDEITCRRSLGMDKSFQPTLCNVCNYLSMLELKLNQFSKNGPQGIETS